MLQIVGLRREAYLGLIYCGLNMSWRGFSRVLLTGLSGTMEVRLGIKGCKCEGPRHWMLKCRREKVDRRIRNSIVECPAC